MDELERSRDDIRRLMIAADEAAAQRQREWEEQWERYRRKEDERFVAKALSDSQQQLSEIMEKWAKAMAVEGFFAEAEKRLEHIDDERRPHLEQRLKLARSLIGNLDPLDFNASWIAPAGSCPAEFSNRGCQAGRSGHRWSGSWFSSRSAL